MIVVVIVAILAAVAVPSYQDSVRKTWRRKASACLVEMAQGMERRYTAGLSYIADPANLTLLPPQVCSTEDNMASRYVFSHVADPTDETFSLQAVPQGAQASGDARCGTLSINQLGVRTVSGTAPVAECW
jgi:type IV pilus assembly protein PilE